MTSRTAHVRRMAAYNAWMNARVFEAAMGLDDAALAADLGAFFSSILGTLNHLAVADTIWLQRFAAHPAWRALLEPVRTLPPPTALDQRLFDDIRGLHAHRRLLDDVISAWAVSIDEPDLDHALRYANTRSVVSVRSSFDLLMHFFNHQTHHRGQVTTLLTQAGVDVGVTDLLALIPNEAPQA